jgi:DegV family protein with EDD domain
MPKISIVTDTDASLPAKIAKKYKIRQVPISVHFGEDMYEDGINIDNAFLFERINKEGKLPSTSAPAPGKFAEVFKESFDEDDSDSLICFCISSAMSATAEAANIAAKELLPDKKITVVDTRTLSMGQAFMAMAAADAVRDGADVAGAIKSAEELRSRTSLYGALATLKYLAMSGRVSQVAAGMAGMLNIKPILSVQNGKLELLEKVRTRKKAWVRMIELVQSDLKDTSAEKMAVLHVNAPEAAESFKELLKKEVACPNEILDAELLPGLSVHTGDGLVGVSFVTNA